METIHYNLNRESEKSLEDKKNIMKIFVTALLLRLTMITLVYLFKDVLGEYLYFDDYDYERYAQIYQSIAVKIIDPAAFKMTDIQMGGISVAQLYFRFNAILYYLTNSVVMLRIANAIFSSLTIIPIYLISKELFGIKEGKISALLYACMPYHIIMSSFLFKDSLIALLMSSSLYIIMKFYRTGKINIWLFLILTIPQEWLRNGIPLFLFGVLGLAIFLKFYKSNKLVKIIGFFILPIVGLLAVRILFADNIQLLISRMNIYMSYGREGGNFINIIRIDGVKQIYKLPLTWIFSVILPLSFSIKSNDWKDIMGLLHYSYLFVAPAYIFYAIFNKKNIQQKLFFYPILALHLLIIIAVLGIPRHYYFLHFYIIICASAYLAKLNNKKLKAYLILVLLANIVFLAMSSLVTLAR